MRKSIFVTTLVCLSIATATVLSGAFIFIGQTQAAGNTYYVATTGSDSNPGTSSQPWRTIQYAANTAAAGDTIIVKSGTYNERVNVTKAGTAGAYTVFKAESARSVNMNGFELNAQYIKVEGFKVSGVGDIAFEVGASNLIIENNEVIENRSMGVGNFNTFATYSNVVVKNNYIYRSAYGVWAAGSNWLIEDNEVERLIAYDDGDNDYMRFFGNGHIFRHNYLHGTLQSEICPPGWTGAYSNADCAHVDGFQTYSNNGEVVNNILFDGNFVVNFHQGVTAQNNNGNLTISNLTFRNNIFWGGGGVAGSSYAGWGLDLRRLINTTVENNYFINVGSAVGMGETNTGVIRNNIFNGSTSVPYEFDQQTSANSVTGGNNIIYKSNQSVWCWQCGEMDYNTPLPGDVVRSNIGMVNPDNPLGADGEPFTSDDGYRLQAGSPAIDAGQAGGATTDIFGNSRPAGVRIDVGPHEFNSTATPPPTCAPNWSCSGWNSCSASGSQSRTCTDLNNCGTTSGRPTLTQSCTPPVVPPVVTPTVCVPNWSCTDWSVCSNQRQSRACVDINNCNTTKGRPAQGQACVLPVDNSSYVGKLVRLTCSSREGSNQACRTVYFVANNGKRYAFPNEPTYKTWYSDFRSLQVLTFEQISSIPLAGVVTSRPGARLVKFDTDPKVYAVDRGGKLRWVKSEALAKELYGDRWNRQIDDIQAWLFTNYSFGPDINSVADYNPDSILAEVTNINFDKGL